MPTLRTEGGTRRFRESLIELRKLDGSLTALASMQSPLSPRDELIAKVAQQHADAGLHICGMVEVVQQELRDAGLPTLRENELEIVTAFERHCSETHFVR